MLVAVLIQIPLVRTLNHFDYPWLFLPNIKEKEK